MLPVPEVELPRFLIYLVEGILVVWECLLGGFEQVDLTLVVKSEIILHFVYFLEEVWEQFDHRSLDLPVKNHLSSRSIDRRIRLLLYYLVDQVVFLLLWLALDVPLDECLDQVLQVVIVRLLIKAQALAVLHHINDLLIKLLRYLHVLRQLLLSILDAQLLFTDDFFQQSRIKQVHKHVGKRF